MTAQTCLFATGSSSNKNILQLRSPAFSLWLCILLDSWHLADLAHIVHSIISMSIIKNIVNCIANSIVNSIVCMSIVNSIVNMSIVNRELPAAEIGSHNLARQCPSRQVSEENMELLKKQLSTVQCKVCGKDAACEKATAMSRDSLPQSCHLVFPRSDVQWGKRDNRQQT